MSSRSAIASCGVTMKWGVGVANGVPPFVTVVVNEMEATPPVDRVHLYCCGSSCTSCLRYSVPLSGETGLFTALGLKSTNVFPNETSHL